MMAPGLRYRHMQQGQWDKRRTRLRREHLWLGSTQPRMKNGTANYLNYKLYSDTLHQTLWSGTSVALTPASADTPTARLSMSTARFPPPRMSPRSLQRHRAGDGKLLSIVRRFAFVGSGSPTPRSEAARHGFASWALPAGRCLVGHGLDAFDEAPVLSGIPLTKMLEFREQKEGQPLMARKTPRLVLVGVLLAFSWADLALPRYQPNSTVRVSTSVTASCTIGTAAIAFAPYDPVNAHATSADDQSGDIIIRCTKGTSGITIDLGMAGTMRDSSAAWPT